MQAGATLPGALSMSNNLNGPRIAAEQTNKSQTANDAIGAIDAALTAVLTKNVTSSNAVTLLATEYFRAFVIVLEAAGASAAIVLEVPPGPRGPFAVTNNTAFAAVVEVDGGQTAEAPEVPPGGTVLLLGDGANVLAIGGGGAGGESVEEAPEDDARYARRNGAWVPISDATPPLTIEPVAASRDLAATDVGRYLRVTAAATLTVPTNAAVPFAIGAQIHIRQAAGGQVTIAAAGGVTVSTAETAKTRKQGSTVTLIKVAADAWDLTGDVELLP